MNITFFTKPFGKIVKNRGDNAFLPMDIPPKIVYNERLISLLAEASLQLGNLSGIGKLIPNPDLIVQPYIKREAVLSSKIEGTQVSINEIFEYNSKKKSKDMEEKGVNEVLNYIKALNTTLNNVSSGKPIDKPMILNAHKILLHNVRGSELDPGKIRNKQAWIGNKDTSINDAVYVAPPPEYVDDLLTKLVKFIQNPPGRIPILLQCAIIHYYFEAIHPFNDGNGRIGRLLIPVLLVERKILIQPLLYISEYIERNKQEYYLLLLEVSQKSKWVEWINFFLHAIISQSKHMIENIEKIRTLREKYRKIMIDNKASVSANRIMDHLFSNPIITIPEAASYLKINYPPAKKSLESLKKMGILKEKQKEQRIFEAHEILSILSSINTSY